MNTMVNSELKLLNNITSDSRRSSSTRTKSKSPPSKSSLARTKSSSSSSSSKKKKLTIECLCGRGKECETLTSVFLIIRSPLGGYTPLPQYVRGTLDNEESHLIITNQLRDAMLRHILPPSKQYKIDKWKNNDTSINRRRYIANHHFHPDIIKKYTSKMDNTKVSKLPRFVTSNEIKEYNLNLTDDDRVLDVNGKPTSDYFLVPNYNIEHTKRDLQQTITTQKKSKKAKETPHVSSIALFTHNDDDDDDDDYDEEEEYDGDKGNKNKNNDYNMFEKIKEEEEDNNGNGFVQYDRQDSDDVSTMLQKANIKKDDNNTAFQTTTTTKTDSVASIMQAKLKMGSSSIVTEEATSKTPDTSIEDDEEDDDEKDSNNRDKSLVDIMPSLPPPPSLIIGEEETATAALHQPWVSDGGTTTTPDNKRTTHKELLVYESKRRYSSERDIESYNQTMLGAIDLLREGINEVSRAQRIILGTAKANQQYAKIMKDVYNDNYLDDDNQIIKHNSRRQRTITNQRNKRQEQEEEIMGSSMNSQSNNFCSVDINIDSDDGDDDDNEEVYWDLDTDDNGEDLLTELFEAQHEISVLFETYGRHDARGIGHEMKLFHEELTEVVDDIERLCYALIGELEDSEKVVVQSWNAYDKAYLDRQIDDISNNNPMRIAPPLLVKEESMSQVVIDATVNSDLSSSAAKKSSSTATRNSRLSDTWLHDMSYRIALEYHAQVSADIASEFDHVFNAIKELEGERQIRLHELLYDYVPGQRALSMGLPPITTPILRMMANEHLGGKEAAMKRICNTVETNARQLHRKDFLLRKVSSTSSSSRAPIDRGLINTKSYFSRENELKFNDDLTIDLKGEPPAPLHSAMSSDSVYFSMLVERYVDRGIIMGSNNREQNWLDTLVVFTTSCLVIVIDMPPASSSSSSSNNDNENAITSTCTNDAFCDIVMSSFTSSLSYNDDNKNNDDNAKKTENWKESMSEPFKIHNCTIDFKLNDPTEFVITERRGLIRKRKLRLRIKLPEDRDKFIVSFSKLHASAIKHTEQQQQQKKQRFGELTEV